MKKFVLVLISVIIMTVFIAFNYLLWDRQNSISLNASKNASIDALSRQIKNLDELNFELREKVNSLEKGKKNIETVNYELQQQITKLNQTVDKKNQIIADLKQAIDIKPMESTILRWADNIDKGKYENAYKLQRNELQSEKYISLEQFTKSYKNSVKSIKVKSAALETQGISEEKSADFIFKVVLEVKNAQQESNTLFDEGVNERYFTLIYNIKEKDWLISDISAAP